ncbi:MAG: cereblon family protein [Gammaproteobacteria bacterium]|nr:cereblon family protein [Gammaproteobacteria bacterium]
MNGSPGIKKGLSDDALFHCTLHRFSATAGLPALQLLESDSATQKLPDDAVDSPIKPDSHSHILCVRCRHLVTHARFRIEFNNQHVYCFRNPAGVDFVICCYSEAHGCVPIGDWTTAHSWFRGYHWVPVLCAACNNHLGWAYNNAAGMHFYGLIMDQLLEERPN